MLQLRWQVSRLPWVTQRTFDARRRLLRAEYAGKQRIVMFDFFDYDTQVSRTEAGRVDRVIDHLEILNATCRARSGQGQSFVNWMTIGHQSP